MPKDNHKRNSTAIRFPVELYEQLVKAAEERDLSVNYLVNKAVEDFLPRLIPIEEFTLVKKQYFPDLKGPIVATKPERNEPSVPTHLHGYGRHHEVGCEWLAGYACTCQ